MENDRYTRQIEKNFLDLQIFHKQMNTRSSKSGAHKINDEIRLLETSESLYQLEISYISQFMDLDEIKPEQNQKTNIQSLESTRFETEQEDNFHPNQVRVYRPCHGNRIRKDPGKPNFKNYSIIKPLEILIKVLNKNTDEGMRELKPCINYTQFFRNSALISKIVDVIQTGAWLEELNKRKISVKKKNSFIKFMNHFTTEIMIAQTKVKLTNQRLNDDRGMKILQPYKTINEPITEQVYLSRYNYEQNDDKLMCWQRP